MVLLQVRQLHVPPDQRLLLKNSSWSEFEEILNDLGKHRADRSDLMLSYGHFVNGCTIN